MAIPILADLRMQVQRLVAHSGVMQEEIDNLETLVKKYVEGMEYADFLTSIKTLRTQVDQIANAEMRRRFKTFGAGRDA